MYNIIINLILCSLLFPQSSYNLYSPAITLPTIGEDETMHFGFWLNADIPDSDGNDDDYLDDDFDDLQSHRTIRHKRIEKIHMNF